MARRLGGGSWTLYLFERGSLKRDYIASLLISAQDTNKDGRIALPPQTHLPTISAHEQDTFVDDPAAASWKGETRREEAKRRGHQGHPG